MDPKASARLALQDPLIVLERKTWREMQRKGTDGELNPWNLLFFDESNFHLYSQQRRAWGLQKRKPLLFVPAWEIAVALCAGTDDSLTHADTV